MKVQRDLTYGNLALNPGSIDYELQPRFTIVECPKRRCIPEDHSTRFVFQQASARLNPELQHAKRNMMAILSVVLVAVILFSSFSFLSGLVSARREILASQDTVSIVVEPGDSLWSIAQTHAIEGLTTQQVSDYIREVNALDNAMLQPGMDLVVPRS